MKTGTSFTVVLAIWVLMSFSSDKNENLVKRHLMFKANEVELTELAIEQIDQWFENMDDSNIEMIRITGFAAPFPNPENTKIFGMMRAYSIKNYLEDKGIPSEKIEMDHKDASTLTCEEIPEGMEKGWRAEVDLVFKDQIPLYFRN